MPALCALPYSVTGTLMACKQLADSRISTKKYKPSYRNREHPKPVPTVEQQPTKITPFIRHPTHKMHKHKLFTEERKQREYIYSMCDVRHRHERHSNKQNNTKCDRQDEERTFNVWHWPVKEENGSQKCLMVMVLYVRILCIVMCLSLRSGGENIKCSFSLSLSFSFWWLLAKHTARYNHGHMLPLKVLTWLWDSAS